MKTDALLIFHDKSCPYCVTSFTEAEEVWHLIKKMVKFYD